jgi:hypothetical protein
MKTAWTNAEIVVLTRAYLNVAEDPAIGVNQTGDTLWARIFANFTLQLPATTRTAGSLQDKWIVISRETTEFNGLYENLKACNPSGANEEDIVNGAALAFKENKNNALNPKTKSRRNHSFKFLDSWKLLREHPKWGKNAVNLSATGSVSSGKRSAPSEFGDSPIESLQVKRPSGRDSAKKQLYQQHATKFPASLTSSRFMEQSVQNAASMQKLAQMAEDRNALMLFSAQPESAESQEFFARMRARYLQSLDSRTPPSLGPAEQDMKPAAGQSHCSSDDDDDADAVEEFEV